MLTLPCPLDHPSALIQTSYSTVCDLNSRQVVFKALITLHQMIRSGSTDTLMEVLSQGNALRLGNVSGQNWEGELN